MNDTIPKVRITGQILLEGEDIYAPARGHDFPETQTFPHVAFGLRVLQLTKNKAELDEIVERSLQQAALWHEVKDFLHRPDTRIDQNLYHRAYGIKKCWA